MRNKLTHVRANSIRPLLTATLALAITLTLSCSSGGGNGDDDGGGNNGSGGGNNGANEGRILTYGIENVTESSFTAIDKWYYCQENGTLEEETSEYPTSYTIDGSTLSFGGAEFSGNSASLIGTWNSNSSSLQDIRFDGNHYGSSMSSVSAVFTQVSKAVFTQNSLSITQCAGEIGERERRDWNGNVIKIDGVAIIEKGIDCGTVEYTKGTETVRIKVSTEEVTATYKGRTCKVAIEHSESQIRAACTQAYEKAKDEGYDDSYRYYGYYDKILYKEENDCHKSLPEWTFYDGD
jgi:hypothetical protein